jgi:serine/threonine protein kinase
VSQNYEYFGKYILLEKLATGGMAEVWLARAPGAGGIGKFVAIKKILPQYSDNPEFIQMFKDEAAIAMNLSQSNIVSIYEFGQEKNQLFLVMDYVEGRNLRQILNKMKQSSTQFSPDQIIYAVKEVAAGLDHAHRSLNSATGKPLNITHRDMSPQNIMITFEGEVRIVDFGIAKAESQMENTRTGTLKGKFGYMSPEQAEGLVTDLRTDIFSLGICLWELLANDRLFIANNEINTLRKIRECNVPSLTKLNPNINSELERITMKALTRDRNLRYQTAAAMHRDLSRFLNRQYPDFSPHDFSVFIKTLYTDEILETRKRLVDYAKIPFKALVAKNDSEEKTLISFPQSADTKSKVKTVVTATVKIAEPNTDTHPTITKTETFSDNSEPKQASNGNDVDDKTQPSFNSNSAIDISSASNPVFLTGTSSPEIVSSTSASDLPTSLNADSASNIELEKPKKSAEGFLNDQLLTSTRQQQILVDTTKQNRMNDTIPVETIAIESTQHKSHASGARNYSERKKKSQQLSSKANNSSINLMVFIAFAIMSYVAGVSYFPKEAAQIESIFEKALSSLSKKGKPTDNAIVPIAPNQPAPTFPDNKEAQAAIDPTKAPLIVHSLPSGAEIYIDGVNTGELTPARILVSSNSEFSIKLRLGGFLDYSKSSLSVDQTGRTFTATLQKALEAYIDIDVKPPVNIRLYVNGAELKDELPITKYAIPAGSPIVIRAVNVMTGSVAEETVNLKEKERHRIVLQPDKNRIPSSQ